MTLYTQADSTFSVHLIACGFPVTALVEGLRRFPAEEEHHHSGATQKRK